MVVSEFQSGGVADADDFNCLIYETGAPPITTPTVAKIGDIFGTGFGSYGYGGNSLMLPSFDDLPTVNPGTLIFGQDWINIIEAYNDVADHQGTTLPDQPFPNADPMSGDFQPMIDLISADPMQYFDNLNSDANNMELANNRFMISPSNSTVSAAINADTLMPLESERTTPWSTQIIHEFFVHFNSFDEARFFFNTGGQIHFSASRTGGSGSMQNTNWTTLLTTAGIIHFGALETTQSGTGGSFPGNIGFYDISPSFQTIFTQTGSGAYAANDWTIQVRRDGAAGPNGSPGQDLTFRSIFNDDHPSTFEDQVDGTFTSSIDELRSIGVFPQSSPLYFETIPLTSGS